MGEKSASSNYEGYDVFLNHRGPDVKNTLASSIYHSLQVYRLRVFLDRDELCPGDVLSDKIEHAIRTASVHVAIFSRAYAQSKWCLDELLLMLKSGTKIIPVFYDVQPSDLRWVEHKGIYADAFKIHEQKKRFDLQTLENWKKALQQVSHTSGFVFDSQTGDHGKLLRDINDSVLREVKSQLVLEVAEHPVGMHDAVQDFENRILMDRQSDNVKIVGIVGMGGSGKTTLAKEIYNRKCKEHSRSCFLFDVRESAAKIGLPSLQRKLLEELLRHAPNIHSANEGKGILRQSLKGVRVLIVIDDIDDKEQLDALLLKDFSEYGSDSLILVTSRDERLLVLSDISSLYRVKGLDEKHACELFCWHAFRTPSPSDGFEDLVKRYVTACSGLPLSLKVFGGLVIYRSDKEFWESQLKKISKFLPGDVKNKLKISYDALDTEEKQMFLDIACFFLGEETSMAIRIWDGSGLSGLVGLRTLQEKCLVELESGKYLKMHDHLRDLGRETANDQFLPRRFWRSDEAKEALLKNRRSGSTTEVRGICLDGHNLRELSESLPKLYGEATSYENPTRIHRGSLEFLTRSSLRHVTGLQLLVVEDDCIMTKFRKRCGELLWLRWYNCPYDSLPPQLLMENVRVLDLIDGRLETLWGAGHRKLPVELRELNILSRLGQFPKSIGSLTNLEKIVVNISHTMRSLPEEFCFLRSLNYLELKSCVALESLPSRFGDLTNLQHLDMSLCKNLRMLPESFGCLIKLRHLCFEGCRSLAISPDSLGNITTLEFLSFDWCAKLEVLPAEITRQRSLKRLSLLGTTLKMLPHDLGELSDLEVLQIESDHLTGLPHSMGTLSSLRKLTLGNCAMLKFIPDSVGQLKFLKTLSLFYTGVEYLPREIADLLYLEHMSVANSPMYEVNFGNDVTEKEPSDSVNKPRNSMFSLKSLELAFTRTTRISIHDNICPNLENLIVSNCEQLTEMTALPTALVKLKVESCKTLETMSGLSCAPKLRQLDITSCGNLQNLPNLEHMKLLEDLNTDGCWRMTSIEGLQRLDQLKNIQIAAGNEIIWKGIQCLQRWPSKMRSMILSARVLVGGDYQSEVHSILNTCSLPLRVINSSRVTPEEENYISFPMTVAEAKSCCAALMVFVPDSSSYEALNIRCSYLSISKAVCMWDNKEGVSMNGECIVMGVLNREYSSVKSVKLGEDDDNALAWCYGVKKGWMIMGGNGEERKVMEIWEMLVSHVTSKGVRVRMDESLEPSSSKRPRLSITQASLSQQ